MPDTITVDADHVEALQQIAGEHQRGADSALGIFATTGQVPDRDQLLAEIQTAVLVVEDKAAAERNVDYGEELDNLYQLETWVETHRFWWGIGHHYAGAGAERGATSFAKDPAEAVDQFVAWVQSIADTDDYDAEGELYVDNYDCGCGHGASDHVEDAACEDTECGCQGFQPDLGEDAPTMRAAVDKALADDPPQPGTDYTLTVEDNNGDGQVFWLKAIVVEGDEAVKR